MSSSVQRFLGRRDRRSKSVPDTGAFGGLFVPEEKKKLDKDDEKRIKNILVRLQKYGINTFTEANVNYALQATASAGNGDEALRLLLLFEDTYEGLVKAYNPSTKLLGAENRNGVTCYLDALLFAMFARLDSFEAMLYNSFEDLPRKKLAGLLRLWVNMLRSGKIITKDITKHLQQSLAECGWESAAELCQQDTSEAFTFITGQLELPLLTLKMDLFHTGKEDPTDDHKFVNERLLEVAILTEPPEGSSVITLEDCLENYFNNRIEVKRHLDRRNTLQSVRSHDRLPRFPSSEKASAMHIETVEYFDRADSPKPAPVTPVKSPSSEPATPIKSPLNKIRPGADRPRADSIFSQRRVEANTDEKKGRDDAKTPLSGRPRKNSIRTEVLMPAWQFFKLLPWYTDNVPQNDAQVAAHFSRKRPVLGIALKRYRVSNTGVASRLDTYIDIPLEIAVPNFVSDDEIEDGSPLVGSFKLVLQSVVCHRGASVNSGHYVSLVRGSAANAQSVDGRSERPESSASDEEEDPWMLFDDLAKERVTYVDINQKLKEECPYLVFYQVQPVDDEYGGECPPSYDEATSRHHSDAFDFSPEKLKKLSSDETDMVLVESGSPNSPNGLPGTDAADWTASNRTSLDIRGRTSLDNRRSSIATDDASAGESTLATSVPSTPLDESRGSFLGLPSRRGSRVSSKKTKSRPGSTDGGSRFSLNMSMSMSKLASRVSRTDLTTLASAAETDEDKVKDIEPDKENEREAVVSGSEASAESLKNVPLDIKPAEKERTGRSKARKDRSGKNHEGHFHRKRTAEKPDRECSVM